METKGKYVYKFSLDVNYLFAAAQVDTFDVRSKFTAEAWDDLQEDERQEFLDKSIYEWASKQVNFFWG